MSSARLNGLKQMIRPLVRYALKGHNTLQDFVQVLKVAFVEVGVEELTQETEKINVSRLSLMTGLHRQDLNRIFKEQQTEVGNQDTSIAYRTIGQWEQDPRFLTKDKKPRVLTYRGEESEFRDLVLAVSKALTPGTVLFELERIGAVTKTRRGLKLLTDRHRTERLDEDIFKMLSTDVENLILAVEENYQDEHESRNLHLTTHYDNIAKEDIPKIREWFAKEGRKFHKRARDYLAKYDQDIHPSDKKTGGAKVAFSTFSRCWDVEFEEEEESE